jgi:hypothetical protein
MMVLEEVGQRQLSAFIFFLRIFGFVLHFHPCPIHYTPSTFPALVARIQGSFFFGVEIGLCDKGV